MLTIGFLSGPDGSEPIRVIRRASWGDPECRERFAPMEDFLFDLENPVENLDNVPAGFRPIYVQTAEGFRPDPAKITAEVAKEIFTSHNALKTNFKSATAAKTAANAQAAEERVKASKYETVAKAFNAKDPDTLQTVLKGLTDKVASGANIDIEQIKKDIVNGKNAEIEAERAEKEAALKELEKVLVDNVTGDAIIAAKGSKPLLAPIIKQQVKMVKLDGGGYAARVVNPDTGAIRSDPNGSPLTINALVEQLKTNADFASAFQSAKPSGGGGAQEKNKPGERRVVGDQTEQKSSVSKISAGLSSKFGNG